MDHCVCHVLVSSTARQHHQPWKLRAAGCIWISSCVGFVINGPFLTCLPSVLAGNWPALQISSSFVHAWPLFVHESSCIRSFMPNPYLFSPAACCWSASTSSTNIHLRCTHLQCVLPFNSYLRSIRAWVQSTPTINSFEPPFRTCFQRVLGLHQVSAPCAAHTC